MQSSSQPPSPGEKLAKMFVDACRSTGSLVDIWNAVGVGLAISSFFKNLDRDEQEKFLSYVAGYIHGLTEPKSYA